MVLVPVTVFAMASLGVVDFFLAGSLEQSPTLGGIAHHGFQSGLLLLLDSQHRIVAHLYGDILLVVRNLLRRWTHSSGLLHGLGCISLDKAIQSSLSK
jgi:hypothetical protein